MNVEGNPEAGNNYGRGSRTLCAKGNSAMQVLYDPARIPVSYTHLQGARGRDRRQPLERRARRRGGQGVHAGSVQAGLTTRCV